MILALSSALDRLERDTSSAAAAESRLGRGVVVRVPRGVGGLVLHLSDLLGGPLAELLGLGALGAPTLRQEVVDGLHVDHAQHVRAEGGQQVTDESGGRCDYGTRLLVVLR